jgi:predicted NBD/HSP70 family sugar kinase
MQYARHARVFSRMQISEETGLSPSTVTHVVRRLIDEGYLIEAGTVKASGGRPQTLLEFRPESEVVAVVDVRRGHIDTVLADWYGTVVSRADAELTDDALGDIEQCVSALARSAGVGVRAVCVAIPGVASEGGQVRLAPSVGLADGQPLGEQLRSRLRVPVVVDNDVNLMVVGEHVAGAGKDAADIALIHVGESGIGCGLMVDGRVRHGASGVAGEIGFLPLGAPRPPRDGVGCFEAQWSGDGIARAAAQVGLGATTAPEALGALEAAAAADDAAGALLAQVIEAWAAAAVSTICVLDPELVLFSGAATRLSEPSRADLFATVGAYIPGTTPMRMAQLGEDALLEGAVRRAFDAYDAATLA